MTDVQPHRSIRENRSGSILFPLSFQSVELRRIYMTAAEPQVPAGKIPRG